MKYFMISNFAGDKKSKLKYHKHHIILKIKINLNEMRYFWLLFLTQNPEW